MHNINCGLSWCTGNFGPAVSGSAGPVPMLLQSIGIKILWILQVAIFIVLIALVLGNDKLQRLTNAS